MAQVLQGHKVHDTRSSQILWTVAGAAMLLKIAAKTPTVLPAAAAIVPTALLRASVAAAMAPKAEAPPAPAARPAITPEAVSKTIQEQERADGSLHIKYTDLEGNKTERTILPEREFTARTTGNRIVGAWCELREDWRSFIKPHMQIIQEKEPAAPAEKEAVHA